jgi:dienelactone hydrolase
MQLEGFEQEAFNYAGDRRVVFRRGVGPGVVIMHEIPGITPEVADFARRVSDAGLTAFLPWMFGTPGKSISAGYVMGQVARLCVSREFHLLARRRSSPITEWLRALCRHVHSECGGPGVGALGMCLTGGFALSLMVDESVMAPVLSQPSLPLPVSASHRCALGISDDELDLVKQRVAAGCPVLGLRFTEDWKCPGERFKTLRTELGEGFEPIEIDSSPANPHGIKRSAHMVLTGDFVDKEGHPTRDALDRVLAFLRERLLWE